MRCDGIPVVYANTINGWCGYLCEEHRYLKSFSVQRRVTDAEQRPLRFCEYGLDSDMRLALIAAWDKANKPVQALHSQTEG